MLNWIRISYRGRLVELSDNRNPAQLQQQQQKD